MKFSHATADNALAFSVVNGVHNVGWSVDLAFGVHPDFKSYVGRNMFFKGGKGSPINISAKQKLNTESLTMAESVGVDCVLPLVLWVPLFLKESGCEVKENVIHQDNKSTISLAKNGKASSGNGQEQ